MPASNEQPLPNSKAIRAYTPMSTVLGTQHPKRNIRGNPNYKGDLAARENRDANIDESQNCKTYVRLLPPRVTPAQLLGSIRNCGKVKACHINGPNELNPNTSDAAITFFDRASAEAFVRLNGTFRVGGAQAAVPQIRWNRQKVAPENDSGKSRVLRITGNREFVNLDSLEAYFRSKFEYQVEKVVTVWTGPGMQQMDWYFSGWYPQAMAAKMALDNEYPNIPGNRIGIHVEIRPDPCAFGPGYTA